MTNGIELENETAQSLDQNDLVPLAAFPIGTFSVWTALMLEPVAIA